MTYSQIVAAVEWGRGETGKSSRILLMCWRRETSEATGVRDPDYPSSLTRETEDR